MSKRNKTLVFSILIVTIFCQMILPSPTSGTTPAASSEEVEITIASSDAEVTQKITSAVPGGLRMLDHAIAVLSKGLPTLSPEEQAAVTHFFDPGSTGQIDQAFIDAMLSNYQKIRQYFLDGLVFVYDPDSPKCSGMRLYHTKMGRIYICPYIKTEDRTYRIARDLIHEIVHMSLAVLDRAYYYEHSTAYEELTPQGPAVNQLPVIGRLLREITRQDTLFHPDAYAYLAATLSGTNPRWVFLVAGSS